MSEQDRLTESRRLDALAELRLVGTGAEERFDKITRLARELFEVPDALINLIGAEEQFSKSPQREGTSPYRARTESFCEVTISSPEILIVEDATQDERFSSRVPVNNHEHVRFYAGRPLDVGDGRRVGSLCIVDTVPRTLTPQQVALLDELGKWVERELRAEADRSIAASIQQSLLPRSRPFEPRYDIRAVCVPARNLAGDFYDWTVVGETLTLTVADVMGKGDGSAILAALVRATVAAQLGTSPGDAITSVNSALHRDLSPNGSFATLLQLTLDSVTGEVSYADAGHGLTVVVHADGRRQRLCSPSLPIGILLDGQWDTEHTVLEPGDWLISVTDGVLDLYDGTLDSLERVADTVGNAEDAEDLIRAILSRRPEADPDDDVTVVVLRRVS